MSSRLDELAERRRFLVARSERQRAELAALLGGLQRKLAAADTVVTAARRWHRHRFLVPAAVVALMFVPAVARGWVHRALSMLPFVIREISTARKESRS